MIEWITGNIIEVKHWTSTHFSLIVHAPIDPFIAGQFTKLRLNIKDKKIQRAYSYVNAPKSNNLEFYLVVMPNGKLSPLLHKLVPGDSLMLTKKATGSFILDEVPLCKNLWMIATGTALGPYLSILEQGEKIERFQRIVLVYAIRFIKDLHYLPKILELQQRYKGKLVFQAVISREDNKRFLKGRIPELITNGSLEESIGLKIEDKNSHIMLCGNPKMINDMQQVLQNKYKMRKHFKDKPGHITSEQYW